MWPVNKSTALTFRPRSVWCRHLALTTAAFALTLAAVYFFSQYACQTSNAAKGSKAIAILEYKPAGDQAIFPDGPVFSSRSKLNNIKTRISTPSFIRQALSDSRIYSQASKDSAPAPSPAFVAQLLQGLSVRTGPGTVSGENLITLDLNLSQCPDADKIVRALADRFVREYRTFWAAEALKAYQDASSQADNARHINHQAVDMLQVFEDNVIRQEKSPPEQPLLTNSIRQFAPQIADNPAWIELDRKLASLGRQETAMLENKTPLHPDVQNIRARIADFQQQLDSTPRLIPETAAHNPIRLSESSANPIRPMDSSTTDKMPSLRDEMKIRESNSPENTAAAQIQTAEILKNLQLNTLQTEHIYQEKLAYKQMLCEIAAKEPSFSVRADRVAYSNPHPGSNRGFIGFMLFSGFAMALGTGVFSSGLSTQSVLATIADLEPLLPVPIIGVVPAQDQLSDPIARRLRRTIHRWILILSGCLIILGCSMSLFAYYSHPM